MSRSAHPKWVQKLQNKIDQRKRRGTILLLLFVALICTGIFLLISNPNSDLYAILFLASIALSILFLVLGVRNRKSFIRTRKIYGYTICFVSHGGKKYLIIEDEVHDQGASQTDFCGELPDGYPIRVECVGSKVVFYYHERSSGEVYTIQ